MTGCQVRKTVIRLAAEMVFGDLAVCGLLAQITEADSAVVISAKNNYVLN